MTGSEKSPGSLDCAVPSPPSLKNFVIAHGIEATRDRLLETTGCESTYDKSNTQSSAPSAKRTVVSNKAHAISACASDE